MPKKGRKKSKSAGGGGAKVAPPQNLAKKGRNKQKMHKMRNSDQKRYDEYLEAGLEATSRPKRPGLGYKKQNKMSMREEAYNTKIVRFGVEYRKMPVEFIKSKEVYDPAKLVNGFRDMKLQSESELELDQEGSGEKEVEVTGDLNQTVEFGSDSGSGFNEENEDNACESDSDDHGSKELSDSGDEQDTTALEEDQTFEEHSFEYHEEHSLEDRDEHSLGDQEDENDDGDHQSFYIDVDGDTSLLDDDVPSSTPSIIPYHKRTRELSHRTSIGRHVTSESEAEIEPKKKFRTITENLHISRLRNNTEPIDGNTTSGIADDEMSAFEGSKIESDLDTDALVVQATHDDYSYSDLEIDPDHLEALQKMASREIGDFDNVPNIGIETSILERVINSREGADGTEYLVEWNSGVVEYVLEDDLVDKYISQGYTEQDAVEIVRQLGGFQSDSNSDRAVGDYDEVDDDEDDDDDDYEGNFKFGFQYQEQYSSSESELDNDELDAIISQLITADTSTKRGKQRQAAILDSYEASPPVQKYRGKGKNKVPDFNVNDEELQGYLAQQWQKSRASKAEKRRQREQDRHEGKLSKKYKQYGELALADVYTTAMTYHQVIEAVYDFLNNESISTLSMPPMKSEHRTTIRDIGNCFQLRAKDISNGKGQKFLALIKQASTTSIPDHERLNNIKQQKAQWFPRSDLKNVPVGKMKGLNFRDAARAKSKNTKAKHQEGDVVGSRAEAIQSDNIGHQLLEKMGWTSGTGLGAAKSGIVEPLLAKVKTSKKGLGTEH